MGQVAVAHTEIWTDSIFLLKKGHHRWESRVMLRIRHNKLWEWALNACWPVRLPERPAPLQTSGTDGSGHFSILCQARAQDSLQIYIMLEIFFLSSHLNVPHLQRTKENHLIFHFKLSCLLIVSVLKKAFCWSSLIRPSFPVDGNFLFLDYSLCAIGPGVDRLDLPLGASYPTPLSLNFFLCKEEL